MYDFHVHSAFSSDSKQSFEDIYKTATKIGLKGLAITDHIEKEHPLGKIWDVDYNSYINAIDNIIEQYGNRIMIAKGAEFGILTNTIETHEIFASKSRFDFIIVSVHRAKGAEVSQAEFRQDKTQREVYKDYLEDLLCIVKKFNSYSVLGHIDLIVRYGDYDNKYISLSEHGEMIDEILKVVIEKGKGIEVNTSGYKYGLNSPHPNFDIIKRYKDLGGEIITTGSDAHIPEYIGHKFEETYEMLKNIGFNYITIFKEMKPQFIKI